MFDFLKKKEAILDKILDTSVIIDGRIIDVLNCGFLEGRIIVPKFVVEEIQKLSDSSDEIKRKKGERGFDFLKVLKDSGRIVIDDKEPEECRSQTGVDSKITAYCKAAKAKLVTLDYNLNQTASLLNIPVININDLIIAFRQKISIGDIIWVKVIRPGNEKGQGAGNLDDGSLVIIDNGFNYIGQKIRLKVREIVQRPSGRIIFATISKEE
jgi:uncharacterized protein YacL